LERNNSDSESDTDSIYAVDAKQRKTTLNGVEVFKGTRKKDGPVYWQCSLCSYSIKDEISKGRITAKFLMAAHINLKHKNAHRNIFQGKLCGNKNKKGSKMTKAKKARSIHPRTSTSSLAHHPCNICPRSFPRKKSLALHQLWHKRQQNKGDSTAPIQNKSPKIMTFYPTMDEFRDFQKYISFMESQVAHEAGIARVIPPPEYIPRRNGYGGIDGMIIPEPLCQNVKGKLGIYEQRNTEMGKISVGEFQRMAESDE